MTVGQKTSGGGRTEPSNPSVLSLYLFLCFLLQRKLDNVLESSKKKKKIVEKENWRKERGRFWKVESRENKKQKGRGWDIWVYVCGGEKSREKKKHMDDRKKKRKINK